ITECFHILKFGPIPERHFLERRRRCLHYTRKRPIQRTLHPQGRALYVLIDLFWQLNCYRLSAHYYYVVWDYLAVPLSAVRRFETELARDELSHLRIDSIRVQSVLRKQQALTRVFDQLIREAKPQHANFVEFVLFQQLHHCAAEPTHQVVIFCGND